MGDTLRVQGEQVRLAPGGRARLGRQVRAQAALLGVTEAYVWGLYRSGQYRVPEELLLIPDLAEVLRQRADAAAWRAFLRGEVKA